MVSEFIEKLKDLILETYERVYTHRKVVASGMIIIFVALSNLEPDTKNFLMIIAGLVVLDAPKQFLVLLTEIVKSLSPR